MEESKTILGYTSYKGLMLQQHESYQETFRNFLSTTKPKRILEIGTGAGGLTVFMRDTLNELGLNDTYIKSYDINTTQITDAFTDTTNLEILKDNLFSTDNQFTLERADLIEGFIKSEGLTIVMCDGGHKINEFKQISPMLKTGDIIMAHDYCENYELFEASFRNKIWNWCEIKDSDIQDVCSEQNLVDFMKEEFNKIVWVCKVKN